MDEIEAMEFILDKMKSTKNNAEFFESSDRLHNDIKDEFEKAYPTNYRGMGVREKVASGILNVYSQRVGASPVTQPFAISMPAIRTDELVS